ncbi:unnamed protein product, partial [Tuber melanosporum]
MKHRHPAGSKWQANATSMSPTPIHLPFLGAARDLFLRCCPVQKKKKERKGSNFPCTKLYLCCLTF